LTELNDFVEAKSAEKHGDCGISLCGKLEAIIGNYFLSGAGVPGERVETLYYDPAVGKYDAVPMIKENIVAYFIADESIAFIKSRTSEKLQKDSAGYGLKYIVVDDFDDEELCVDTEKQLPVYLDGILWIDDDFMNDETMPFDYEAFEDIDSGVEYLNPKHFSASQLMRILKKLRRD